MKQILGQNIKDIIAKYPAVSDALAEYKIGCSTCNVGTCQLKDIVEMHALSIEDEKSLFTKIAAIIFPGVAVEIPQLPRKAGASGGSKKMSPAMEMLVEEHRYIKQVLAAIPGIVESLESTLESKKDLIRQVVGFVRNYADAFHHAKEEDILFGQFDAQTDIIATMLKEHDIGRGHIKAVLAGLDDNDAAAVALHLTEYGNLLKEHIRKEDEILYPWMDRNLTDSQVGKLFSEYSAVEQKFGDAPQSLVAFAKSLSAPVKQP